jgi:ATP-dependent exoDNAse (exonuclease V) beta subunit
LSRRSAQAAGEAVHRILELCDLSADRTTEFEARLETLATLLRPLVSKEELASASARAQTLLQGMRDNGMWDRFFDLQGHVIARELDVVLPPTVAAGEVSGREPTGYVAGTIDLLYRDPVSGELVLADYKSDFVEDDAALEERSAIYRAQGRTYVKALRTALELAEDPRFELWFLHAGRVEVVPV